MLVAFPLLFWSTKKMIMRKRATRRDVLEYTHHDQRSRTFADGRLTHLAPSCSVLRRMGLQCSSLDLSVLVVAQSVCSKSSSQLARNWPVVVNSDDNIVSRWGEPYFK